MTFKQLRRRITNEGPQVVQWIESGIVELATVTENGAICITNVVTKKSFKIPRSYKEIKIRTVTQEKYVTLGSLLPK